MHVAGALKHDRSNESVRMVTHTLTYGAAVGALYYYNNTTSVDPAGVNRLGLIAR